MNLTRSTSAALLFTSLLFLPGCSNPSLQVTIPSAFVGTVRVTCASVERESSIVTADANGQAEARSCPHLPSTVIVMRGGQQITPASELAWIATGDGIPQSLSFTVK